jgi:hypothetical protein
VGSLLSTHSGRKIPFPPAKSEGISSTKGGEGYIGMSVAWLTVRVLQTIPGSYKRPWGHLADARVLGGFKNTRAHTHARTRARAHTRTNTQAASMNFPKKARTRSTVSAQGLCAASAQSHASQGPALYCNDGRMASLTPGTGTSFTLPSYTAAAAYNSDDSEAFR